MTTNASDFLNHASSDESDNDTGYDSEAAEISKSASRRSDERARKRRKLSHSSESEGDSENELKSATTRENKAVRGRGLIENEGPDPDTHPAALSPDSQQPSSSTTTKQGKTAPKEKKRSRPGVIYLSSLPPYLRPSALRNILTQRGFSPITRLFLAPASSTKSKTKSKSKSSRQMYSEGWIEFLSHKTARRCVDALNAQPVGGKKGGYYHDDVWNMRYLRGMGWEELMEGVRGERREEEARRDEERRRAEREARLFVEDVGEGKKLEGMREKRRLQGKEEVGVGLGVERKRTWRQFEVHRQGQGKEKGSKKKEKERDGEEDEQGISKEAREVLGKIF